MQLREPIARVASLYEYQRLGLSAVNFTALSGKEQQEWDFNTCVKRKQNCNVFEKSIRRQMDEVRLMAAPYVSYCCCCCCVGSISYCFSLNFVATTV